MHVFTIMWSTYLPLVRAAADDLGLLLTGYSNKQIGREPEIIDQAVEDMRRSDLVILYRTSDAFWDEIETRIKEKPLTAPLVVIGPDPGNWNLSTVDFDTANTAYQYVLYNGRENMASLLAFLCSRTLGMNVSFVPPAPVLWEGIYHPGMGAVFSSTKEYLHRYRGYAGKEPDQYIGILYSRTNWIAGNLGIERSLIAALEDRGFGVIPVFYYSMKDQNLGNLGGTETVEKFLMHDGVPQVDGLIKLNAFFLGNTHGIMKESEASAGVELLKRLNIPIISPVISYYKTEAEWDADAQGLGSQAAWSIAMPEFEGVIEPLVIGATSGFHDQAEESYHAIPERAGRLADRVAAWMKLRSLPNQSKKVAFILHNNPCASVEASVGGGAHLDTLESVARILKRLQDAGYAIDAPADGKEIISEIMRKKAISEFRWTPVEEIVAKGGAIAQITPNQYLQWFLQLPEKTRARMEEAWGKAPGEEKDGVPAAMIHEGNIVVTGIRYGNALVSVQPKRGCAGARCDGQVCKILHDPSVPPPHQYVAAYQWIAREFGADMIVHVGTHGNLEFLPGKSSGLSSGCFPDIGIGALPHLYIYNADNPPEGTVAKRRSYGVLVDHMQTVMVQGELYGDLEQLERLLDDYEKYRVVEPAKAHSISHMIKDKVKTLNLFDGKDEITHDNMDSKIRELHGKLSLLKNTYIPKGMHVFGNRPEGEKLADFIYAILRYEIEPDSLRGVLAEAFKATFEDPAVLKEEVDKAGRAAVRQSLAEGKRLSEVLSNFLSGAPASSMVLRALDGKVDDLIRRVEASDEIASILNGFGGGYIEAGPSGLITRGRSDVLPTGRNFFSLDPQRIPTPSAWVIGQDLGNKTLDKYYREEGKYPENIAFHWMSTDIMWADGEGLAQMMFLLGARPIWQNNGRVKGFEIIPLDSLGRPRIDITVRISGITRDNFPGSMELLDEVVQAVARLEEPEELNFVRKHTLENLGGFAPTDDEAWRKASYRIFASQPGTYQAGTQLAVYASAWKTENDLADVFLYWNGYAYGKGTFGAPAHASLKTSLQSVDLTFSKTATDEYDLTGCCCYFGTHGGMINAARVASGRDIKNYYGDTRDRAEVSVRTLTEEIRRVARAKLLNPVWIEGMKEHGYKGAGEISKRLGRLYGWQATAKAVDGSVFDDAARTFMLDEENRRFFEENNPWALEEMARRLLEAAQRGLWQPAPDVERALQDLYIEIEGWIEEKMENSQGDFQGGGIDIVTQDEVIQWKKKMEEVLG